MPFKSEKQRRFMWAKHPEIAQRWADEAKSGKKTKKKHRRSVEALKDAK